MPSPRFYCPQLATLGTAALADSEAHHLTHVLRLTVGEPVELFNGQGLVGQAVIQQLRKHEAICEIQAVRQEPRPMPEIILGTAVPKGERFDWLVEKATELGVSRLVPLITARSTVEPRDSKLDRLRQTIIAACKQCRRSRLMELTPALTWRDFLKQPWAERLLVADPTGRPIHALELGKQHAESWAFAVGPEGGLTEEEIASAQSSGGRLANLGEQVLRIETAGLALAAWGLLRRSAAAPPS